MPLPSSCICERPFRRVGLVDETRVGHGLRVGNKETNAHFLAIYSQTHLGMLYSLFELRPNAVVDSPISVPFYRLNIIDTILK